MLMLWLLLLYAIAAGQDIDESTEDTTLNTTTLYPTNKTIDINRNHKNYTETKQEIKTAIIEDSNVKENQNQKDKYDVYTPKKEEVATWAIEATYVQPKDNQSQAIDAQTEDKRSQPNHAQPKDLKSEYVNVHLKDKKNPDYSQAKVVESDDSSSTDSKEEATVEKPESKSKEKEFKPSPHLGSFFDDENLNLLKFSTSDPSIFTGKKPAIDFLGSKDFYTLNYKTPKDTYQLEAPYRFESSRFLTANNWKQTLDSKPTVESAVKVPAGGLYKHSNPFKQKPIVDSSDDDYGLSFNEYEREKENPVKKRSNPWKSLVQLMTAFLPVGLIISALTPSVITLQSTDNAPYLGHGRGGLASRRLDGASRDLASVPAISEPCRRRLLCEIHAEENYLRSQNTSGRARKHCYKLHCEDPHSLRRVLSWLLAHRPGSQVSHQPDQYPGPQRYADIVNYHYRHDDFT